MGAAEPAGARPPWGIAGPARPGRLAGVTRAGSSGRASDVLDVQVVPRPVLSVLFDLGEQPLVIDDGTGQHQRERVVAGLAPIGARGRGSAGGFERLQVRPSPVVAHAVLGASSELGGAVVVLDDLWGRDAVATQANRAQRGRGSNASPSPGPPWPDVRTQGRSSTPKWPSAGARW